MAVLQTALTASEARLVRVEEDARLDLLTVIRKWEYVDATVADTLVPAQAATVTNPQADGQTYTGTFAAEFTRGDGEGDRSVTVTQVCRKLRAPTTAAALAALTPIVTQENEILEPFDLKTGEGDNLAFVYKHITPGDSSRASLMGIADNTLAIAIAPDGEEPPGTDWTYVDRKFQEMDDGTATFTVVLRKIAFNAWSESAPDLTWKEREGTPHERLNELWLKVTVADPDGLSNIYTADTDYNVMEVDARDRGDGSMTIRRTQWYEAKGATPAFSTAIEYYIGDIVTYSGNTYQFTSDHPAGAWDAGHVTGIAARTGYATEIEADGERRVRPHDFAYGTVNTVRVINRDLADKTDASVTISATKTGYTQVDQQEELNRSGLWDVTRTYEKVTWEAWAGHSITVYDHLEVQNAGRQGEVRVKTWYGIQIADTATAVAYLDDTHDNDYHVTTVDVQNNGDGSINLRQTTVGQVIERAHEDGNLTGTRAVDPHAIQSGTITTKRSIFRNYESDPGSSTPTGNYVLVAKIPDLQRDGLYTFVYDYELPAWLAWDHDSGAADLTEYADPSGDRETIVKTWFAIANTHKDTAATVCRNGTGNFAAESGYVITSCRVNDNRNGSITVQQTQRKQVNGLAANDDGGRVVNPHARHKGITTTTETIYSDFAKAELPAGDAVGANDVILNESSIQGNGLWGRRVVVESIVWENDDTPTPGTPDWDDKFKEADIATGSLRAGAVYSVPGVPVANLETVLAAVTAESGYEIANARAVETGNGAGTVTAREVVENDIYVAGPPPVAGTAHIVSEYRPEYGSQDESEVVTWYNITEANADLIVADAKLNKNNMSSATYQPPLGGVGDTAHKLQSIRKISHQSDKLFDVVRVTFDPDVSPETWVDGSIDYEVDYSIPLESLANGVDVAIRTRDTRSAIQTFLQTAGTNLRGTTVHYNGRGRWSCVRVRENP